MTVKIFITEKFFFMFIVFMFNSCPLPPPQKKTTVEQLASHSKSSSPLLTLWLNPPAHLFILTRSYLSSVHLLHSIIAKQAVWSSK